MDFIIILHLLLFNYKILTTYNYICIFEILATNKIKTVVLL